MVILSKRGKLIRKRQISKAHEKWNKLYAEQFFGVKRALTDGDLKQFETEYNIAMPLKIRNIT